MLCTLGVRVCDVCVYDKCVYDIRVSRRVGICNVLRRVCDVRVFDVRVYDAQRLTAVYMDRIPNIICQYVVVHFYVILIHQKERMSR